MTYNPRQTFEAGRGSIYSSYKPPSRSNANKQAASSMASVGIGGLSGKPTTSAAKRIQDKFRKETQKDNNRNTGGYDPVGGGSVDDPGYKGPGLGSPPNTGNNKDDSSQDTFIDTLMKKVKSSFNFAGGTSQNDEPTDPDPVSVYTADVFASPVIQVGYENPNDMRSGEEIATDIARMFDRSKDKGYYQYSTEEGSRYDEVPAASANKNLDSNKTKSAVERFLKEVIAPDSKQYKIKKNDTLSAIALREGVTVEDLVKVNGIKDKDKIYTDETLIPESKDMQKVKDFVDSIDPDAQFYQSGVPMDQREFAPEDTSELNNPQTQQGLMSTDPVSAQEDTSELNNPQTQQGLMSTTSDIPEVTVTELDDDYVAAEDTTRTPDEVPAPDYATMSMGEAGRPDTGGIMTKPKMRPGSKYSEKKLIQQTLQDLGYGTLEDKNGNFDGKIGGGSQRAIRKFQKQHGLKPTGIVDPTTYNAIVSGDSDEYPDPRQEIPADEIDNITDDKGDFEVMKKALAKIESGPHGYSVYKFDIKYTKKDKLPKGKKVGDIKYKAGDLLYGGSGGHYLGKYQMGEDALSDVGVGYTKAKREAFLKDPVAQDKAFKKYTKNNHNKLTRESQRYRDMTEEEKLGVLGYAHNQGATAAVEWLFTGVSGADANGTKGTKYTTKIAEAFADPNVQDVRDFYEVTP